GFRVLMNTIFVHAHAAESVEITEASRSGPVVATVGGTDTHYQGSYEIETPASAATTYSGSADDSTFDFPDTRGHLRAIDVANLQTAGSVDSDADITAIWDAADGIPTAQVAGCSPEYTVNCRTVFTNTATGANPNQLAFKTGNLAAIKAIMASSLSDADATTLMSRVLAGHSSGGSYVSALGGVDRSTLAVIEPSPILGTSRPTMAYFGARDGMLHAFCADSVSPCTQGKELWAFIPRTQLPLLKSNTQQIQGSPKVSDLYGDFQGTGNREWRTVLTFQTGHGDATVTNQAPTLYAIDVTNPAAPDLLWELALPGSGLNLALGPISGTKQAIFVETNLNSGGPGVYVAAVNAETGTTFWTKTIVHSPGHRTSGNADVPTTAIVGGVGAFDLVGQNLISHIVVPTIYGELWLLNADTGTNPFGTNPLFRFQGDFNPVGAPATIYYNTNSAGFQAIVVSGGYADDNPLAWSPDNQEQYAVSVPLDENAAAPIDETTAAAAGGFVIPLGQGARAFGQATVGGNEVFIVTDTADINSSAYGTGADSGTIRAYDMGSANPSLHTTINVPSGAAAVDVKPNSGQVFVGGGMPSTATVANFNSSGTTAELSFTSKAGHQLWLRLR
ncbi:MAG TPA: hypothetical protein VL172_01790, partial [Kofleriaceae bacterium]|nr:hypothetical protein [Kofleriaceae bacterium]